DLGEMAASARVAPPAAQGVGRDMSVPGANGDGVTAIRSTRLASPLSTPSTSSTFSSSWVARAPTVRSATAPPKTPTPYISYGRAAVDAQRARGAGPPDDEGHDQQQRGDVVAHREDDRAHGVAPVPRGGAGEVGGRPGSPGQTLCCAGRRPEAREWRRGGRPR